MASGASVAVFLLRVGGLSLKLAEGVNTCRFCFRKGRGVCPGDTVAANPEEGLGGVRSSGAGVASGVGAVWDGVAEGVIVGEAGSEWVGDRGVCD